MPVRRCRVTVFAGLHMRLSFKRLYYPLIQALTLGSSSLDNLGMQLRGDSDVELAGE